MMIFLDVQILYYGGGGGGDLFQASWLGSEWSETTLFCTVQTAGHDSELRNTLNRRSESSVYHTHLHCNWLKKRFLSTNILIENVFEA